MKARTSKAAQSLVAMQVERVRLVEAEAERRWRQIGKASDSGPGSSDFTSRF